MNKELICFCISLFCILSTFVVIVDCDTQGVCSKTQITTAKVWAPFTRRRIETYYTFTGRCYPRGCSRTRWRVITDHRLITKTQMQTVLKCCLGYIELNRNTSSVNCQPVCTPACQNGYCKAPGECACNQGYVISPNNSRICLPSCNKCEHGACTAPNTCQCHFGYTMENSTCRPICTEPCSNGTCTAPETCQCNIGYRKSDKNICKPYCSAGCENGTCVGPETCACDAGYRKIHTDNIFTNHTCSPYCSDPCVNATCIAPDTCQCIDGYEKFDNNTCRPQCENGCNNGTCISPGVCGCDSGWRLKTASECESICKDPCGNGTCVAPSTCECFPGYEWNSTCVPRCTDGCEGGECVSPNICHCKTGHLYQNGTCLPVCKYSCGNGSCISPDVCRCFNGYRLDMVKLLRGDVTSGLCMPKCANCSGACVAPNICVIDVLTTEQDNGSINGSTTDDGFLYDSTETASGTEISVSLIQPNDNSNALKKFWLDQRWAVISVSVLLILIIALVALVVFRWRYLRHYFKGDSYKIQGDITDGQRTSSFVDVSFSALEKRDKMKA